MPEIAVQLAAALAIFVAGVILGTKVKDWLQGVPGSLRTELNAIEVNVKAQVAAAQSHVVAGIKAQVVPPTPVLQTSVVASVATPAAPVTATVTGVTQAGIEPPHA